MIRVLEGCCLDTLRTLPPETFQTCVTSPPYYGLRDYGVDGQIGLEDTPDAYVARLVEVFREVRRTLRDDGTLWLNLGDSYSNGGTGANKRQRNQPNANWSGANDTKAPRGVLPATQDGCKPKDLLMIPARVALALRADGWYLRSDIIWHKPNPMPESVRDRPTSAHEHVFLLTKRDRYYYDAEAIREPHSANTNGWTPKSEAPDGDKYSAVGNGHSGKRAAPNPDGRNARNVWTIATQPFSGAHFATMPPNLAERCVKAGSKPGDHVLDPFGGAGTTALVADRLNRHATICELNPAYAQIARERLTADAHLLAMVS